MKIILNGRTLETSRKVFSYDDIVSMAFSASAEIPHSLTVTYKPWNKPDGSLVPGEAIEISDGMIFNVAHTAAA